MRRCENCDALAFAPNRIDVPPHLNRLPVDDAVAFTREAHVRFQCLRCNAKWRWQAPDQWVASSCGQG